MRRGTLGLEALLADDSERARFGVDPSGIDWARYLSDFQYGLQVHTHSALLERAAALITLVASIRPNSPARPAGL